MSKSLFIGFVLALFLVVSSMMVSASLTNSIVSYYTLNESSGISFKDSLGFSNQTGTGTITAGQTGIINNSVSFGGGYLAGNVAPSWASYNWTFSAWVYPTSLSGYRYVLGGVHRNGSDYDVFGIGTSRNGDGKLGVDIATSSGTAMINWQGIASIPLNQWSFITVTIANGKQEAYINGVSVGNNTIAFSPAVSTLPTLSIGNDFDDLVDAVFAGKIDEVGMWSRTLSSAEILQLYNNGFGFAYPFTNLFISFVSPSPLNNSVLYFTNNSVVLNTTSNLSGVVNTSQFVYYSNGSLFNSSSSIASNFSSTFVLPVGTFYFNATASNGTVNISTDTRFLTVYNITPGVITIPSFNQSIIPSLQVNWTNSSIAYNATSVSNFRVFLLNNDSSLNSTLGYTSNLSFNYNLLNLNLSMGIYYVGVSVNDSNGVVLNYTPVMVFYPLNSLLNVTALNITGGAVSIFNVSAYDLNTSITYNYVASAGYALSYLVLGDSYSLTLSSVYATAYANVTVVNVSQSYQFVLQPYNSVNVSIFDEVSKVLISQPINIYVQSSGFYQNYSTSSGDYVISNLPVGNYTVTLSGANYTSRSYVLSVNPASSQLLSAYLLQNSSSSSIDIYVKGVNYQVLPGALMTVQRQYYGGSYATVAQGVTDANGFLQLNLQQGVLYNVILSASSYSLKSFTYTFYVTNSPYTFVMSGATSGVYAGLVNGVNYFYSPTNSTLDENTSYAFQITAFNANSSLMWVAVNVNGVVVNVTGSAGGATASEVYNTGNLSVFPVVYSFYYYNSNDLQYEVFSIPVSYSINQVSASNSTFIQAAQSFQSQTSQGWLAIVGVFGILAAVATIVQLSGNTLAGAVVGMAIMVVEAFLGWISAPIVIAIVMLNGIMLYVGSR